MRQTPMQFYAKYSALPQLACDLLHVQCKFLRIDSMFESC